MNATDPLWLHVRALVLQRAHGICEGCGVSRAEEVHHRQPRGMGGVHGEARFRAHSPSNLLALCAFCHRFTEENPTRSRMRGWLVPHPHDPADIPALLQVVWGDGWFLLDDELTYARYEDRDAVHLMLRLYGLG